MEFESFITGFVDGEGCFSVSFSVRKKTDSQQPSFKQIRNGRSDQAKRNG